MAHSPNDICLFPQQGAANDPYLGLACGDAIPSTVAPHYFPRPPTQQPDSLVYPLQPPVAAAFVFFGATYPDSFPPARRQQPDSFVAPIVERSSTFFDGWAPDKLDRRLPQQPDSFVTALRERTATFFDAVGPPDRRSPLRAQQPESETLTPQTIVSATTFVAPVFPDWLPARRVQQPDSETLTPRDRTSPAAAAVYPDSVVRPLFAAANQLAVAFTSTDRTAPLASVVAPDRLDLRPRVQPEAEALTSRDRTAPAFDAVYPDRVVRPTLSTADQLAVAFTPTDRTAPLATTVFPDRLDPRRVQQPEAEALTSRDRTVPAFDAVYPDRVVRPTLLTADQLALVFVEPETNVPDDFDTVFPDRLDPRRVQQPDAEALTSRDRTSPAADAFYPDRVVRPTLSTADQLAVAFTPTDRTAPLASVVAPDRFDLRPRVQPEAEALTSRDRTAPAFDAVYPDRVVRPTLLTADQLALVFVEPETNVPDDFDVVFPDRLDPRRVQQPDAEALTARDRTSPAADAFYPDRVVRPTLSTADQLAVAFTPTDRTAPIATTVFPDRLDPRRVQQPDAEVLTPRDRTAPAFDAVYPDRVVRPTLLTADQLALAYVTPETKVPDDFDAVFPDRLDPRRVQQPDAESLTSRDRTAPAFDAVYPDRVVRPTLLVADQLAHAFVEPETKVPDDFDAVFPDRLDPRRVQQPDGEDVVLRDRTSPAADAVYPDRVIRPALSTADQLAVAFTPTDRTAPLATTVFPDRLDPRRVQQPDAEVLTPRDRTAPAAAAVFPDAVRRPTLLVADQLAHAFVEPETTVPDDFDAVYPDRLDQRPRVQPEAEILTPRDRTVAAFDAVYPDRVTRPVLRVAAQQAFAYVTPETKVPDDFDAVYTDKIDRRTSPTQMDVAAPIAPERSAPLATAIYPDRLDPRRVQQPAALVETLVPPAFTFTVEAFFPSWIERRSFHPSQQQALVLPVARHLAGVTRDAGCTPLPFCTVHLFRTADDVQVGQVVSDAAGNYSFAVWDDGTTQYYVVAYLPGAPDLAGTSVNTLVST